MLYSMKSLLLQKMGQRLKLKEAKLLLDSIKSTQSNTQDLEIKVVDMLDEVKHNILLTSYH